MRRKTIILLVIALGCGSVAAIGISEVLKVQEQEPVPEMETVDIYVADTTVAIGVVLTPQMVKLEPWPKDRVPDGAITDWENIQDRRPKTQLFKGEAILEAKLIDPNDPNTPTERIPKGFRVLPIKVTSDTTSGLVQPGDEVDVLVVLRQCGAVRESLAKTILKKARVFAINEHFYRRDDAEGGVLQARTVSLQVTPRQVEVLTLAQKLGDLSLAFRSPGDEDEGADLRVGGTSIADLMRTSDMAEDVNETAGQDPQENVLDFVRNVGLPNMRMAAQPEPASTEPAFRTQIIDANGSRWYEYGPDGNMPREVIPGAADANNVAPGPPEGKFDLPAALQEMQEMVGDEPVIDDDANPAYVTPDS
jgi:pilus assembly protein CpaB